MSLIEKESNRAADADDESSEVRSSTRDQEGDVSTGRDRNEKNVRRTRSQEAVKTLLSSFGENVDRCTDEFTIQDIKFKDLSALSDKDLALLGVTDAETQSVMLETFQDLPNQEMHYDQFCATAQAQEYNEQILESTQTHLNSMNTSLSAAYLKMLLHPPKDVVVDERIFASRLVLEALEELKKVTDDMEDRLRTLEQAALRNAEMKLSNRTGKHLYKTLVIVGGLCAGMSIAFWFWKGR